MLCWNMFVEAGEKTMVPTGRVEGAEMDALVPVAKRERGCSWGIKHWPPRGKRTNSGKGSKLQSDSERGLVDLSNLKQPH